MLFVNSQGPPGCHGPKAWAQRSGAQLPLSPFTRQPLWEPLLLRLPELTPQGLAMMRLAETEEFTKKIPGEKGG